MQEQNDDRLMARVLQQRWPTQASYRERCILRMMQILEDVKSSPREKVMAFKAILAAEAQNQKDEHTAALQSDRNRFLEVAQQLGIGADFRLVGQEPAGANHVGADGSERRDETAVERYRAQADDEEQGG